MSYKSYITTPVHSIDYDVEFENVDPPSDSRWRKRAHKLYERRWRKLADKMARLDYDQLRTRRLIF